MIWTSYTSGHINGKWSLIHQATEILFSCKKSSPNNPLLIFYGTAVTNVIEQKHLGIILDSDLSFEEHLTEKSIKAKQNIELIKHLSKCPPLKTLDQVYKTLVRPHLVYCDIIYHEPPQLNQPPLGKTLTSLMVRVERVQYQADPAVTGAWHGSNRCKLYGDLGWEKISDYRMCSSILHIHNILNNKSPSYLKEKLPPNRRPFLYSEMPVTVFTRYMNSFFSDAVASCGIFIEHFENIPSFDTLKDHLITFFRPETKSIFRIHGPIGIRYILQLRVSLSPLRSHKKRHNFIDTPSEICHCTQGIEDTNHFLFSCSSNSIQRAPLVASVNEILQTNNLDYLENQVQLYLYGHQSINFSDNRKILMSTIKNIKYTRRFST